MDPDLEQALDVIRQRLGEDFGSGQKKTELCDNLMLLAIHARGYNNYQDFGVSGERFFVEKVLAKLRPTVCVDVGANVGKYAALLLEATEARVYAFEPLAEPFEELSALARDHEDRLTAVNKGVGDTDGSTTIHFNPDATVHASICEQIKKIPYVTNAESREIDIVTLDTFFGGMEAFGDIGFVKIDTEGFEFEVLQGAARVLGEVRPMAVQIEYNWHQLFRSHTIYLFSEILKDYSLFQLLPNRMDFRDPGDPLTNIYHFSNFVFIRTDLLPISL